MAASKGEGKIKPIDRTAVHRICSGQVVLDLATAVKELVENSLDAGATSIDIRLKDHGAELIEVADNGSGVAPENYQGLTLKYHTSKISKFADLQSLSSFGFRGEALSSLCALAKVSIVTRTKDEPVAVRLEYDHSGLIVSQENVARSVGTTVSVAQLFSPLPVRFKELRRETNIRREYGRLVSVLQAYALIAKGVRLICSNQKGRGGRNIVVQTQGTASMRDNIVTVFGTKTAACMERLDLTVSDSCTVEGFVSKPGAGSGRPLGDRQFFYVNGRPVDMPKLAKVLNELYRSFNSLQYPMLVLNFILPTTAYDVNVTPDKRKLFLHSERELMVSLRESLEKLYAPAEYTYTLNNLESGPLSGKVIPSAKQLGRLSNKADVPVQLDTPADAFVDEEEAEMREGGVATVSQEAAEIDINDSGRVSLNLFSFQHKSTKGLTDKGLDGTSGTGSVPSVSHGKNLHNVQAERKVQAKLTACISRTKKPLEESDGALLSEEPLLKQWMQSSLVDKKGNEENREGPVDVCDDETGVFSTPDPSGCNSKLSAEEDESLLPCCTEDDMDTVPAPVATIKATVQARRMVPCSNLGIHKRLPIQSSVEADTEKEKLELGHQVAEGREQLKSFGYKRQKHALGAESVQASGRNVNQLQPARSAVSIDGATKDVFQKKVAQSEGPAKSHEGRPVIQFDMANLRKKFNLGLLQSQTTNSTCRKQKPSRRSCFAAATLNGVGKDGVEKEAVLKAANNELERSFSKADFKRMKVLGQFNLGFILAKIDEDIFIIDQHASDEKYNFERLSKTTVLNRQPLLRPLQLELSVAEEMTVVSHMETFRHNGFDFVDNESAPAGQRLRLSAVPFSQNVTFGVGDVQELISLLVDEPVMSFHHDEATLDHGDHGKTPREKSSRLPRPSRVRAMLASRACRSSIMIGDPLSKKEMERVLCNLAELDSPWNCPHGRPTMRHLVDLGSFTR